MKNLIKDPVLKYFGEAFMDKFHDYPYNSSLWRYQHRCRMKLIDNLLSKVCKKNMVALDAGAGKGPVTVLLSRYLNEVYTFEYDKENVKRINHNIGLLNYKKNKIINIKQQDLKEINLPNDSIDVIVCSEVIEHIDNYSLAMNELYRVCKPGGKIIFSMPNRRSSFWKFDKFIYYLVKIVRKIKRKPLDESGYSFWERSRHWKFTAQKIRKISTGPGFKIKKEYGIGFFFFNEFVFKHFCYKRKFLFMHKIESYMGNKIPRLSAIYFLLLEKRV